MALDQGHLRTIAAADAVITGRSVQARLCKRVDDVSQRSGCQCAAELSARLDIGDGGYARSCGLFAEGRLLSRGTDRVLGSRLWSIQFPPLRGRGRAIRPADR